MYSLSKQSNLAGYRAAFVAGDPRLVARLVEVRKHAGMIVPAPVQAAMTVALADDAHVDAQRERVPGPPGRAAPAPWPAPAWSVDGADAGLYLWVRPADRPEADRLGHRSRPSPTAGHPRGARQLLRAAAARHVRVALTASDERVAAAGAAAHRRTRSSRDALPADVANRMCLAAFVRCHGASGQVRPRA